MRWLNDSACMTSAVDALWPDAQLGISDGCRRCEISYDRASGRFSGTCTEPEPACDGTAVLDARIERRVAVDGVEMLMSYDISRGTWSGRCDGLRAGSVDTRETDLGAAIDRVLEFTGSRVGPVAFDAAEGERLLDRLGSAVNEEAVAFRVPGIGDCSIERLPNGTFVGRADIGYGIEHGFETMGRTDPHECLRATVSGACRCIADMMDERMYGKGNGTTVL